jgi:hypothetical protein
LEAEILCVEALPSLILNGLVPAPVAPTAGTHAVTLPIKLLALKRGAADEKTRSSGQFPAFRPIPIPSLAVASSPIFSFETLPLAGAKARQQVAQC